MIVNSIITGHGSDEPLGELLELAVLTRESELIGIAKTLLQPCCKAPLGQQLCLAMRRRQTPALVSDTSALHEYWESGPVVVEESTRQMIERWLRGFAEKRYDNALDE